MTMEDDLPIIDIDGYRRLQTEERRLGRSPEAITLAGVAALGLVLSAVGGVLIIGSLPTAGWDLSTVGCVLALAGALIFAASFGLSRLYLFRRLARLRCPYCGGVLGRHVADLTEAERGRWGEKGIYLDGRRYSAPFVGESDRRPWVRAMKEVWACVSCRAYIDSSMPHDRTCSEEELTRLQQHSFWKEAR
jgi:hypothetical protein